LSDLTLVAGQTATGMLTFDLAPPSDGAVQSDNPSFVPVSLAADGVSWTVGPVSADPSVAAPGATLAHITYTGTSVSPDAGPAVVPPISASVTPAPVAETGNFNAAGATIS
jgi:hypothetical protein